MRNLTALLLLLSLCSLHLVFSAPLAYEFKDKCCSVTSKSKIPLKNIVTYFRTGSSCHLSAIIFKTKFNREICVDPEAPWIISHMKALDARKKH